MGLGRATSWWWRAGGASKATGSVALQRAAGGGTGRPGGGAGRAGAVAGTRRRAVEAPRVGLLEASPPRRGSPRLDPREVEIRLHLHEEQDLHAKS